MVREQFIRCWIFCIKIGSDELNSTQLSAIFPRSRDVIGQLVISGLGEQVTPFILRIKGVRDRMESLNKIRDQRRNAGLKSAELRATARQREASGPVDFPSTSTRTRTRTRNLRTPLKRGDETCVFVCPTPLEESKTGAPKKRANGIPIWEAYRETYLARYKIEPLRNAKVNSLCCTIAEQLGATEGIVAVKFFVNSTERFYEQKAHDLAVCVKDLQKIFVQMKNGGGIAGPSESVNLRKIEKLFAEEEEKAKNDAKRI